MTPRVIELERANEMRNKSGAASGPSQTSPPIAVRLSAREQDTPDRVGQN